MRLLFIGSGEFGLPTLEGLHAHHDVAAVVTQPDRPAGRRRKPTATPIAQWAQQQGLDVLKVEDINTPAAIEQVRAYQPEASIVVAFGQKLSPPLIEALGGLAVNLHGSLLPAYRGAAPVNWAVINGEKVTGVTVIGLAQRMDAGEIYATAEHAIDPHETAGELHDHLARLGPRVVEQVLWDYEQSTLKGQAQDDAKASRAPKLTKADGTVDFNQPAEVVRAWVHGLTPWPGCRVRWHCRATGKTETLTLRRVQAITELPTFLSPQLAAESAPGTVLEPLLVMTSAGMVKLLEVQASGTRPMDAQAFARGHQLAPGDRLEPLTEATS